MGLSNAERQKLWREKNKGRDTRILLSEKARKILDLKMKKTGLSSSKVIQNLLLERDIVRLDADIQEKILSGIEDIKTKLDGVTDNKPVIKKPIKRTVTDNKPVTKKASGRRPSTPQAVIDTILKLRFEKNLSYNQIADKLEEMGMHPTSGKRWNTGTLSKLYKRHTVKNNG